MLLINVVLFVLLVASALSDTLQGKIYNKVTYPAVVVGLLLNLFYGGGVGVKSSLLGLGVGFTPFFVLCLMGLMHGGDVKLLSAIGAIKGYPFILHAIFLSFLVAGFLALAKMIWKEQFIVTMRRIFATVLSIVIPGRVVEEYQGEETVPFGLAAFLGSLWALGMVDFNLTFGF